jgi:hypothetical protein
MASTYLVWPRANAAVINIEQHCLEQEAPRVRARHACSS